MMSSCSEVALGNLFSYVQSNLLRLIYPTVRIDWHVICFARSWAMDGMDLECLGGIGVGPPILSTVHIYI